MGRPVKHTIIEFSNVRYYQKPSGYYKSDYRKHGGRYLHRMVWEHSNGPIPEKCCVHHINGDKSDNHIENLGIYSLSGHAQYHVEQNFREIPEKMGRGILAAREVAKEWHRSPEGRKWHSEHGRKTWEGRKKESFACVVCGKEYWTYRVTRKRGFCSMACQQRNRRAEGKKG